MAVRTLTIIFRIFLEHYLIFGYFCEIEVNLNTDRTFVFPTANKFYLDTFFIFHYWLYDFDATSFCIYFFNLHIFFIILFCFGILSHHPTIDSSHWLEEDVKRIMDKIFRERLVDLLATLSSRTFLINF